MDAGWIAVRIARKGGSSCYFFLRGTVFGLILLVGLGALVRRRWEALLPWTVAVAAIVVPPTTAEFDYRYVIPAVPAACVAAALAFTRRDPAEGAPAAAAASADGGPPCRDGKAEA
ncbi:hypothetical protein NE236_06715 [Actinoallomurus purpureus]|uniref:hypothetical protein n=1 Tax=Actinoallomurus purpureus TaxID=478114 RepID=UPI002093B6D0|nr:hypothetical protein [Actinoallomurus purpureus]MCO6004667.1 hypothetical protein [Actinoallomurus purpureus]